MDKPARPPDRLNEQFAVTSAVFVQDPDGPAELEEPGGPAELKEPEEPGGPAELKEPGGPAELKKPGGAGGSGLGRVAARREQQAPALPQGSDLSAWHREDAMRKQRCARRQRPMRKQRRAPER